MLRGNLQHYQSVVYKKINTVKKQELKNHSKLSGTKNAQFSLTPNNIIRTIGKILVT